ncbi:hypothetical protein [Mycobacterium angelicum]|uniref:hypothetical protein n=1 Tax=Mycobacterium angelicum TaxID=470074 RepID=UPI00111C34E3|nr:hypothetical protein [Mycobacterium angelicum]MCV7194937.1 hypothetical protein [Mycobacterium angelicum]
MSDVGSIDAALSGLRQLLGTGEPARPAVPAPPSPPQAWPEWSGDAGDAARGVSTHLDADRNRVHAIRVSATGIIDDAATITADVRTRMAGVQAGWESDKKALWPIVNTPKGRAAVLTAGHRRLQEASGVIRDAMGRFNGAADRLQAVGLDLPLAPAPGVPQSPADDQRRRNQIEAFKKVFGREPVSVSDWDTAAALDPHSYDPKNLGAPPNIVVGRIKPVPGQGVVRTNMFIPGRDVWDPKLGWPPYDNNLGDNRGFSPTVDPEGSRVSVLVDYENGIIVARQNPSVNADTGQVRVGTPSISATQQSNGSVLINYNAADPFSPGGEGPAKAIPISVNGTLAIAPSPSGPHVGGNITTFPAMEIYSDRPGAMGVPLLQSWPSFTDDASGPLVGLPFHKTVGDYSIVTGFNDVFPQIAPPAPPHPPHGPVPVPAMPPMTVLPPSNLTPLGPVSAPPQVVLRDPLNIPPVFLPR